ncbi:hypothetical protein RI367_002811 [Sorochytrium milnesiophthora]
MFREPIEWQGLVEGRSATLPWLSIPSPPLRLRISKSTLAYTLRLQTADVAVTAFSNAEHAHDHLCIQSIKGSDTATFSLPLETYQSSFRGEHVHNIEIGDRFLVLQTESHIRVYPTTPHTHPFRVDIRSEAPFSCSGTLTLNQDVLFVIWAVCPQWLEEQGKHEILPDVEVGAAVLRIYSFGNFSPPSLATDRFTVFPHTAVPCVEVFTPAIPAFLWTSFDFDHHLTNQLAQQHKRHARDHPERIPHLKVVLGSCISDFDNTISPLGHHMTVLAFSQKLELTGVRKYERTYVPGSTKWYDKPRRFAWISVHGNYLIDYIADSRFDPSASHPRLSIYLDDAHSAPLPKPDALHAITNVSIDNWTAATDAWRSIPSAAPEPILCIPCHQLPRDIVWLSLIGHHLVIKEVDDFKVFDLHTLDVVASRSIGRILPAAGVQQAGGIAGSRLAKNGVYLLRQGDRDQYSVEHLSYRLPPLPIE